MRYTVRKEDFEDLLEDWERILPQSSTNTVFLTPAWQRAWWRHFSDRSELCILSVRDGDQLLGIAPLMINDGVLSFVGDEDLFDYRDFIVVRGKEEIFYSALCDHLVGMEWHSIELAYLSEGSPTLSYLPGFAKGKGIALEMSEAEMTPVARLPSSWDEYLAGLSKKGRHELRRKLRRLESADGVRQYDCGVESLDSCMEHLFRLMRASSADKQTFLTPARERFFLDVARELASRDQLRLYALEIAGVPVASCICFDYGDSFLLYNSGYDPDYAHLSVGLLNKALCLREAIEAGKQSFNFLKGTERYKYDLGGKDQAVYRLAARR